ncbi:hypothetical protein CISIN_1g044809mg [Citrus sinensis]|uniref:Uncharacterized protein n=1 Tax=Citrus sinensis TaxID=2711 RepID=A0A067GAW4_CITSI|nr:hypothetical protein CISIN_1g044809mg [Citrus sinensis]
MGHPESDCLCLSPKCKKQLQRMLRWKIKRVEKRKRFEGAQKPVLVRRKLRQQMKETMDPILSTNFYCSV